MHRHLIPALIILTLAALACGQSTPLPPAEVTATVVPAISRRDSLPAEGHKLTPAEDAWPPLVTEGLGQPQPLEGLVNTAGAEDSPFITLDGQNLYFFFTPDVRIPAEKQLLDGVTGIWKSSWTGSSWSEPERVRLIEPGKLALDGCEFVLGNQMWFCSAREGNLRDIDLYTATLMNGSWTGWQNAGKQINLDYEVGEMTLSADGQTMVFASQHAGGVGGYDLWLTTRQGNGWSEPVNAGASVNTAGDENRPFLNADGQTLWFDGTSTKGMPGPAIFRSIRNPDATWSQPEEMVSQFAGDPSLSADGRTLYFSHPYFSADLSQMIEADIYSVSLNP